MAFNTPSWPRMIYGTLQGPGFSTHLSMDGYYTLLPLVCLPPNPLWVALYPLMPWVLLQDSLPTSCSLHSSASPACSAWPLFFQLCTSQCLQGAAASERVSSWKGSGVASSFLSILSHLGSALVGNVTSWSSSPALEDALEKVQCCRHSSLAACSQDPSLEVPLSNHVYVCSCRGTGVVVHTCYIPKPYTGCSRIHLFFIAPFSHLSFLSSLLGN